MAAGLYSKIKEGFIDGMISLTSFNIKAMLYDIDDHAGVITGATNASPIVITQTAHGWTNGDVVTIQGVVGNTAANGKFLIANVTANTYELQDNSGNNVAGNGAYTSGGRSMNLTADVYLSDLTASGIVGDAVALTNKTVTNGVFDADDVSFMTVTGDEFEAVILYYDTSNATSSNLIAYMDQSSGTPFAITPSGGDIDLQWSNGINKIFRI